MLLLKRRFGLSLTRYTRKENRGYNPTVTLPMYNFPGRFVTVGLSSECQKGTTGVVAYAAARHAVLGASSALANELAHLGVSVVVINTGSITAEQLYHGVKVT